MENSNRFMQCLKISSCRIINSSQVFFKNILTLFKKYLKILRDLNPANIMIDNHFNVKLADFGLAKTLS